MKKEPTKQEYAEYVERIGYLCTIQKPVYCLNMGEALNGEFEDSAKGFEILDTSDILQRERSLDDLMWEQINYICALQVFSLDVILAFCAKLQIVVRWLKLDPERGAELFKELVNELRNNKKPIE